MHYKEIKSRVAKICLSDQLTSFSWRSIPICLVRNNSLFIKSSNLTKFQFSIQFKSIHFFFVPMKISWHFIWSIIHLWEDFVPTLMHTNLCWLLEISKIHFKKPCIIKRENNFHRLTWFYIMKTSTTPNSDVYLFWYKVFSSSSSTSISAVANKTKLCGHRSLKIGQQQKIRGKLKLKTVLRIFCRLFFISS